MKKILILLIIIIFVILINVVYNATSYKEYNVEQTITIPIDSYPSKANTTKQLNHETIKTNTNNKIEKNDKNTIIFKDKKLHIKADYMHDKFFSFHTNNEKEVVEHATQFHYFTKKTFDFTHYIYEFSGLKIPREYDCKSGPDIVGFNYNTIVPSRKCLCEELKGKEQKTMLPFFDEEYTEYVSVLNSIFNNRNDEYIIIEMGARWGTWGYRALSAIKDLQLPFQSHAIFYEVANEYCEWIEEVGRINNFIPSPIPIKEGSYQLICNAATYTNTKAIIDNYNEIDLLDIDIQGDELLLLPEIIDLLIDKVIQVNIGTHAFNSEYFKIFNEKDWKLITNYPTCSQLGPCSEELFPKLFNTRNNMNSKCDFSFNEVINNQMINDKSLQETPYGLSYIRDGQLVYLNRRLLNI